MTGPLKDICVLDLSRILAGPWCSQLLADLGAHVIKIEKPNNGDDTRHWGPPYYLSEDKQQKVAGYYLSANRGKKSVAIDITQSEGQSLIKNLVKHADVLIENFKVDGLKKYQLDYASLKKDNPRLVYCSITGFGQDGPFAQQPGYDFVIQGMGGLMSITGEPPEENNSQPQKVGVAVSDVMTGMYSSVAILSALLHRNNSGEGQYIDMALFDCQMAMLANQNMNYLLSGQSPQRLGNAHPNIVPYQVFTTADRHIIIAVGNDAQFKRFCKIIDCMELAQDSRYASNAARVEHRETLIPIIKEIIIQKTSQHWLSKLQTDEIPCGPVNNIEEVFEHPQIKHRNMKIDINHPMLGTIPQVASPIKYSETLLEYNQAPPLLGEHTEEILKGMLNLSDEKIQALKSSKVI